MPRTSADYNKMERAVQINNDPEFRSAGDL